jgi:hypothetical protein
MHRGAIADRAALYGERGAVATEGRVTSTAAGDEDESEQEQQAAQARLAIGAFLGESHDHRVAPVASPRGLTPDGHARTTQLGDPYRPDRRRGCV